MGDLQELGTITGWSVTIDGEGKGRDEEEEENKRSGHGMCFYPMIVRLLIKK